MTRAIDLHRLQEDERIKLIGASVMDAPLKPVVNAFIVESEAKADRYVKKLLAKFPGIRIVDRGPGVSPGTIMVRVSSG